MRNIKLEKILSQIKPAVTTATQAVDLAAVARKQLHRPAVPLLSIYDINYAEFFLLVIKVSDEYCTVIPGSVNGLMAGPNDVVLPKEVLGQFAFLAMDQIMSLPQSSIGTGFAILDDETFERIEASVLNYQHGIVTSVKPYSYALPFVGENCSRRRYHKAMGEFISYIATLVDEKDVKTTAVNYSESITVNHKSCKESADNAKKKHSLLKILSIAGAAAVFMIGVFVIEVMLETETVAEPESVLSKYNISRNHDTSNIDSVDNKHLNYQLFPKEYYPGGVHGLVGSYASNIKSIPDSKSKTVDYSNEHQNSLCPTPAVATGTAVAAVSGSRSVWKSFRKTISSLTDSPRLLKSIGAVLAAIFLGIAYIFKKITKK